MTEVFHNLGKRTTNQVRQKLTTVDMIETIKAVLKRHVLWGISPVTRMTLLFVLVNHQV